MAGSNRESELINFVIDESNRITEVRPYKATSSQVKNFRLPLVASLFEKNPCLQPS